MEQRGQKYHRERLGQAMRDEILTIVEGELADPRIGLASITEVHLAPDGRSAQVLVQVEGNDDEAADTLEGLDAARNYIRHELTERLRLRQAPELFFRLDSSQRNSARIEQLLQRIHKRKP